MILYCFLFKFTRRRSCRDRSCSRGWHADKAAGKGGAGVPRWEGAGTGRGREEEVSDMVGLMRLMSYGHRSCCSRELGRCCVWMGCVGNYRPETRAGWI